MPNQQDPTINEALEHTRKAVEWTRGALARQEARGPRGGGRLARSFRWCRQIGRLDALVENETGPGALASPQIVELVLLPAKWDAIGPIANARKC